MADVGRANGEVDLAAEEAGHAVEEKGKLERETLDIRRAAPASFRLESSFNLLSHSCPRLLMDNVHTSSYPVSEEGALG